MKTITLSLEEYFELIYRSYMEGYNAARGIQNPIPAPFKGTRDENTKTSSK